MIPISNRQNSFFNLIYIDLQKLKAQKKPYPHKADRVLNLLS